MNRYPVVVHFESSSNSDYGCHPSNRPISTLLSSGLICLNKPAGPTSHQVADYVKSILHLSRCGHGGTLDPGVSGVLPLAIGSSTRILQTLLLSQKEYVGVMRLHKPVPLPLLHSTFSSFTGRISQLPPVRSAVKRQLRQRTIYSFGILEMSEKYVLFSVSCQAGTYVRKLIHDVGKRLGVGAHMQELVRTRAGPFLDRQWVNLHDLADAYAFHKEGDSSFLSRIILPLEFAVSHLRNVWVLDSAVDTLCHGASLAGPGISKLHAGIQHGEVVAIFTLKDELVCLGEALLSSEEMLSSSRRLAVRTTKVFLARGTYPKIT